MLPDLDRAERIGGFWSYPKPHLRPRHAHAEEIGDFNVVQASRFHILTCVVREAYGLSIGRRGRMCYGSP
jgi:hypothetical protein